MAMRSDEERAVGAPLKITLGGKEEMVELLPRAKARNWRARFAGFQKQILSSVRDIEGEDKDAILNGTVEILTKFPDDYLDLFFEYVKLSGWSEEKIKEVEDRTPEPELFAAAKEVIEAASPLNVMAMIHQA